MPVYKESVLRICGVYAIFGPNNAVYVGQSVNCRLRWNTHRTKLRSNTHHCRPLQNAWNKYGENCFEFKLMEQGAPDDLTDIEAKFLTFYMDTHRLYNVGPVQKSLYGPEYAEVARRRGEMNRGKKRTREQRERIVSGKLANGGYDMSAAQAVYKEMQDNDPEFKARFRESAKRRGMANWIIQKAHTPEATIRRTISKLGLTYTDEEIASFVRDYRSAPDAARIIETMNAGDSILFPIPRYQERISFKRILSANLRGYIKKTGIRILTKIEGDSIAIWRVN